MLTTDQINDLHRLYWSERWPIRKIERHLNMGWRTIRKYLDAPAQAPALRSRASKLDPFKATIAEWLEKDPRVTAAVIEQRLRPLGYNGGHSILQEYVRKVRPQPATRRAFVRMEPLAGERFEVDWGHFGALELLGRSRKLYAFALVDAHSRMLYVEFTHSQSFETFVRCHIHAFTAMGGVAREIAYDNLATAVAEHDGRLVRFLPRFLGFAREYGFFPHACNPASGWEKGKVERAIGYLRQNFWPLREFTDLHDVNRQVRQWLARSPINACIARRASAPWIDSSQKHCARCRSFLTTTATSTEALVHKDLRLPFDGNRYCVPHRYVGRRLTVKADSSSVTIYERDGRGRQLCTFVAARPDLRRGALRKDAGRRAARGAPFASPAATARFPRRPLFAIARGSLSPRHGRHGSFAGPPDRRAAGTDASVRSGRCRRRHRESLRGPRLRRRLCRQHPAPAAFAAPSAATAAVARSAAERTATDPISLLEYDAFILESGKERDDSSRTETAATEPESDEPPDRSNDR